ncbi:hypothetical protein [Caldithrix abyssi]
MEKIIPRWEWRTFGQDLRQGIKAIQAYPEGKVRKSGEIYILSEKSNDNTKIRDELMDIKTLLRVNQDGLEQWTVLLKAGFPIHINDLAIVYKAFNLPLPYLKKDEYSYDEYLNNLISPNKALHIVNVVKERHGFTINDCIVEIAYVTFNNQPIQTIAVEHADPELVIKTVKELGLDHYENVNYIKAMKRYVGLVY